MPRTLLSGAKVYACVALVPAEAAERSRWPGESYSSAHVTGPERLARTRAIASHANEASSVPASSWMEVMLPWTSRPYRSGPGWGSSSRGSPSRTSAFVLS